VPAFWKGDRACVSGIFDLPYDISISNRVRSSGSRTTITFLSLQANHLIRDDKRQGEILVRDLQALGREYAKPFPMFGPVIQDKLPTIKSISTGGIMLCEQSSSKRLAG
jgi:hypothetical protein